MKKIVSFTLFFLLSITFQLSYAQVSLYGTWKASCPLEKMDAASAKHCDLCPITKKDAISMVVEDFEMTIDKAEVKLTMAKDVTPVKYTWHEDLNMIEFQFKETNYKFKVLWGNEADHLILKNNDGVLLVLVKK